MRRPLLSAALVGVVVVTIMSACGGSSPSAPSPSPAPAPAPVPAPTPVPTPAPTPTGGMYGAQVDPGCSAIRFAVTSVTITIDGISTGTATPGGPAFFITGAQLGNHSLTARSQNGLTWNSTRVLTSTTPDFIHFLACFL